MTFNRSDTDHAWFLRSTPVSPSYMYPVASAGFILQPSAPHPPVAGSIFLRDKKRERERERERGGGERRGRERERERERERGTRSGSGGWQSWETSSKTNWLEGPQWIKDLLARRRLARDRCDALSLNALRRFHFATARVRMPPTSAAQASGWLGFIFSLDLDSGALVGTRGNKRKSVEPPFLLALSFRSKLRGKRRNLLFVVFCFFF